MSSLPGSFSNPADPQLSLEREHNARELQRAGQFKFVFVLAGLAVLVTAPWHILFPTAFPPLTIGVLVAGLVVALYLLLSLRVALQWDKALVLRG